MSECQNAAQRRIGDSKQILLNSKVSNELYAYPDEHPRAPLWLAEDALVNGDPAFAKDIIYRLVEKCQSKGLVNLNIFYLKRFSRKYRLGYIQLVT